MNRRSGARRTAREEQRVSPAAALGLPGDERADGRADGLEASLEYPTWPLIDMAIFSPFFAAAIAYRRKPEIHKRLMIVAATTLLIAAAGRMPLSFNAIRLVWFSPILLGMAYDLVARRRVSPAYAVGLAVLFVSSFRDHLMQTDFWPAFTGWLGGLLV